MYVCVYIYIRFGQPRLLSGTQHDRGHVLRVLVVAVQHRAGARALRGRRAPEAGRADGGYARSEREETQRRRGLHPESVRIIYEYICLPLYLYLYFHVMYCIYITCLYIYSQTFATPDLSEKKLRADVAYIQKACAYIHMQRCRDVYTHIHTHTHTHTHIYVYIYIYIYIYIYAYIYIYVYSIYI